MTAIISITSPRYALHAGSSANSDAVPPSVEWSDAVVEIATDTMDRDTNMRLTLSLGRRDDCVGGAITLLDAHWRERQ